MKNASKHDPLRAKSRLVGYTVLAFVLGLGFASSMGWTQSSLAMPVIDEAPQVSEAAVAPARSLSEAFVNISDVVTPAVVRVSVKRPMRARGDVSQVPEPFRDFFRDREPDQGEPNGSLWGSGSGFIISTDGYILTNNHVVEDAEEVRIHFADRRVVPARVVGTDPFTDVAVVKIESDVPLPTLSLADSDEVQPGEWILAVGNPGFSGGGSSLDFSVTAGIVSARGRQLDLIRNELRRDGVEPLRSGYAIEDFIQTDAVINPGNSGGPMVDIQGRVVGINSAIASTSGYYQGYGFAIPINLARRVSEDLIEYGQVRRPRLGVSIENVAPEDAEVYGLPTVSGVFVQQVPEDGPANGILRPQDIIVAIEGEPVGYVGQLQARVAMRRPGDRITVTVYRDGSRRDVSLRLGEAELQETRVAVAEAEETAEARLGIRVGVLDQELAERFGYEEAGGVAITNVVRGSAAERRTLRRGFKIVEINQRAVNSPSDVAEILDPVESGEIVRFILEQPDGTQRFVNVRMP